MHTMVNKWDGCYSVRAMSRITTIPIRTLQDWKQRGIIAPSVELREGDELIEEGYSYADLTIVRILRALRDDDIDFSSAGTALRHLYTRFGPPGAGGWEGAKVFFVGKHVFAEQPDEWRMTEATQLGQGTMPELFGELFPELRALEHGADILIPPEFRAYVAIDPEVMGGEPVVRGTRVPTGLIAAIAARGRSISAIARLYGNIPRKAIGAVIAYEAFLDSGSIPAA